MTSLLCTVKPGSTESTSSKGSSLDHAVLATFDITFVLPTCLPCVLIVNMFFFLHDLIVPIFSTLVLERAMYLGHTTPPRGTALIDFINKQSRVYIDHALTTIDHVRTLRDELILRQESHVTEQIHAQLLLIKEQIENLPIGALKFQSESTVREEFLNEEVVESVRIDVSCRRFPAPYDESNTGPSMPTQDDLDAACEAFASMSLHESLHEESLSDDTDASSDSSSSESDSSDDGDDNGDGDDHEKLCEDIVDSPSPSLVVRVDTKCEEAFVIEGDTVISYTPTPTLAELQEKERALHTALADVENTAAALFGRAPRNGPTSYKKWGPLSLREWDTADVAVLADTVEKFRPSGTVNVCFASLLQYITSSINLYLALPPLTLSSASQTRMNIERKGTLSKRTR